MKIYGAYRFKAKDPAIDELRTLIGDCYKLNGKGITYKQLQDMERNGGPSVSAMSGWFFGVTMRPNNTTLEAAGRSLGFMRIWVKQKGK